MSAESRALLPRNAESRPETTVSGPTFGQSLRVIATENIFLNIVGVFAVPL
jgi:hypothetical protein